MGDYCRQKQKEYEIKGMHCRRNCVPDTLLRNGSDYDEQTDAKRTKISNDSDICRRNVAFFRAQYSTKNMPKCVLNCFAMKNNIEQPVYSTRQVDRLFQTVVTFDNKQYASCYWEKNKRFAEQGAALVCILGLGLITEEELIKNGSLAK